MAKKNRMEQPWGYREQNEYISTAGMIVDAIGGDKSSDEKFEEVYNKGLFDVSYETAIDSLVFKNYHGAITHTIPFPYIVESAEYDGESGKIIVTFKDSDEKVEVDLTPIMTSLENEKETREEEDAKIWDAIGEIEPSDPSIKEKIESEISARTAADAEIWDVLNKEIQDRTDGDVRLDNAIESEKNDREQADDEIWNAIGDIGTSSESLNDKINNEISDRTAADAEIWDALNKEIQDRTDADSAINGALQDEVNARVSEDGLLRDALENEVTEREQAISNIVDSLSNFIEKSEKGAPNGVAPLNGDGKVDMAYLLGGEPNGLATLANDGKVPTIQLQFPLRGALVPSQIDSITLEDGVYQVNGKVLGPKILNGDDANGVFIQFPWGSRLQVLCVGRSANHSRGEKVETYVRRYLPSVSKWTEWSSNEYGLSKDGSTINLLRDDAVIASIEDSDTTYDGMSYDEAKEGVGETERVISANVLKKAIEFHTQGSFDDVKEDVEFISGQCDDLRAELEEEKTVRGEQDAVIEGKIDNETDARTAEDTRIWDALHAETEAREELSSEVDANKVKIEKITDGLSTNVREAYKLTDTSGTQLGETINIYKDSSLKDVELVDEHEGQSGHFLKFTYVLEDGTEKVEYVDVSLFLSETEFADGLQVDASGIVSVKVDSSSENYLSVSSNGIKVVGIDEIKDSLETEKTIRETNDATLQASILAEETNRTTADNELRSLITNETSVREDNYLELLEKIATEKSERMEKDAELNTKIMQEKTDRTNSYNSLVGIINGVRTDLSNETSYRESADANLQGQINTINNEFSNLSDKVDAIGSSLETEKENRIEADAELRQLVNTKADAVNVYYKDEIDERFATKEEIPTDFYSKADVDEKVANVQSSLTDERDERIREDVAIKALIDSEAQARETADSELSDKIDNINAELANKVESVDSESLVVTVDNTDSNNPKINFNLSSDENQIIKINSDGLYASVTLDYDATENTLTFTTSNGTPKRIPLLSNSMIDKIYYDSTTEEIVIEYTVNGVRMDDVRVPVSTLIEEWRVEDGHQGAIELRKERKQGGDQDVLSARLIINTMHDDNVAKIDGNALYVSKDEIIGELEERLSRLEAFINERTTLWEALN